LLQRFDKRDKTFPAPVIFGLQGPVLSREERAFIKDANPLGFILFARNCKTPQQVQALNQSILDTLGRFVPILIDQEGGRVQRISKPLWNKYPPASLFGEVMKTNPEEALKTARSNAIKIARELTNLGIHVNCAPVLDISYPQTHKSIGDRAFSDDPEHVFALGDIVIRAYSEYGIVPVVKHLPGQGRASYDSHEILPIIDAPKADLRATDFLPYKNMVAKTHYESAWGMMAHVIYSEYDARAPASCSRRMIWDVTRGEIGFKGLLLSDDICMGALKTYGGAAARARAVHRAGCDIILHCNGKLDEMRDVMNEVPASMFMDTVEKFNRSVGFVSRHSTPINYET